MIEWCRINWYRKGWIMIEKTTKEILKKELVIITGMSGAGKSETMDFF